MNITTVALGYLRVCDLYASIGNLVIDRNCFQEAILLVVKSVTAM